MILRQFFNPSLAQYSYLAGCPGSGEAIVVDADRETEKYLEAAAEEGLRITHVTETHIHADYLSGSRELAARTGAHLYLPGQGGPDWSYAFENAGGTTLLSDGDVIQVGGFKLVTWHTPGHTPEHVSFVVYERDGVPLGAFTGDFVFVGDVGRPDLLEEAAGVSGTKEPGARQLFQSLRRFAGLPDSLVIWPAHGAGSACGKSLGGVPVSTLGYEKATNWAFGIGDEDAFVQDVLAGQPEPPKYFAMMKRLNKVGPDVLGREVSVSRSGSLAALESAASRGVVLDVRPSSVYKEGHVRGALHIPVYQGFTNWAGWLIGYDEEVFLVAESSEQANEAARRMGLIGLDRVSTWFGPDVVKAYGKVHGLVECREVVSSDVPSGATLVDVRGRNEWAAGHIPEAVHVPLGELMSRQTEVPSGSTVYVHCQGGGRSPIACSVLERLGIDAIDVCDGYAGFAANREPAGVS